jgi:hypothetical protein
VTPGKIGVAGGYGLEVRVTLELGTIISVSIEAQVKDRRLGLGG